VLELVLLNLAISIGYSGTIKRFAQAELAS
jgi:hypothetical protein